MSKFVNFEVPRTTAGWVPLEESLATLMQRLAGGPYLLGKRFSALDALYGTAFAQLAQLLPKAPLLEQYVERIVTRPAYARALAKDAGKVPQGPAPRTTRSRLTAGHDAG